jgi:hypothetical protein
LEFKIGDRVNTKEGVGTIKTVEDHRQEGFDCVRYGVLHDVFPVTKPRMYPNDILYYNPNDIVRHCNKGDVYE